MSFLNMKGAKTVSNTRSTPLRPSKLRNEIANASSIAPQKDGTPPKSAKLQKPPPIKGTFKPAPKPVHGDHGSLWLERPVMVKPNGTAAVPASKPRPSASTSSAAKTSSSPSPSRGAPTYISPELRSAEHPASRARMSDLFSASGSSAAGHDNTQSDSAAVIAQSRPRVKTLREVGTLGAPKADGRMEPDRLKRYVPDAVSTVTSAYSSGDNWVSTIDKFKHLATVFEESGSDIGSDFLPSFLKLESDSGSSGTLITRASSGVLPADEMAARIKPKDKATAPAARALDRSSKTPAEPKTKSSESRPRAPAPDAASVERRTRPSKVLTPDDSISNFGDDTVRTAPRSSRPPARATKSYDDDKVAFRTYVAADGSLREPQEGKDTRPIPRRADSVPSVIRTSASDDDLRGKRDRPTSKTATPTSNSLGHSSRRVGTVPSLASSASTSTSVLTPLASSFPDAPQFDAAAVTKLMLDRIRVWLPQLGMANLDTDVLFKMKRRDAIGNGASEQLASQIALTSVVDIMNEAVSKIPRSVPPSPRLSSAPKAGTPSRTTRK